MADLQMQAPPDRAESLTRRPYIALSIALLAAALLSTSQLVFSPAAQTLWADNADSLAIATAAQQADWTDIPKWWTGHWIQHEMYYRPLASTLFFIQGQLFGTDFRPYCIVSWIAGAISIVLLGLLGASLARGSRCIKLIVGGITGVLFLLARHPELHQGAGTEPAAAARVTWGIMPWWPVQTDIFSLLCGLLALIALDRWLLTTRRAWLLASAISFLAALLFKETALCIPLMVPLLALYRRRAAVIPATALYVGIAAVFYVVRTLAAPEASGPEWAGMKTLNQFAYYSVHALWKNAVTATWAPIFTSLGLVLLVLVMVWRRIEWVWIVFAVPLWFLLGGQLFAGNFAQYTVIGPWERLLPVLLFWSGAAALVLVTDRGVSPALAVAVAASCIPALNRMGPHYWYWLLAFYALLNASLLNRLWEVLAGRNAALLVPLFPARSEAEVEQPTDPMSSDAPAEASGTQPRDAREQEGNTRP